MTCEPGRSVDVWAKEYFGGKCPYTGKECESWECSRCQVEKKEKEWMEEKEKTMKDFCDLNCKHCVENIEEYYDGTGCAWHECEITGKMVEQMDECPKERKDDEQ